MKYLAIDDEMYAQIEDAIATMHAIYADEERCDWFEADDLAKDVVDMIEGCMERTRSQARFEVPCAFGTLVAEDSSDPGIYDEVSVDLVRADGALMQLATIGTGPAPEGRDGENDLHVYVWDGSDECATVTVRPNMETAVWYGGEEE